MGAKSLLAELTSVAMIGAASGAAIMQDGRWIWCVLGSLGGSVVAVAVTAEQLQPRQIVSRLFVGLLLGAMLTPGALILAKASPPHELLMAASLAVAFGGWFIARFAAAGLERQLPWLFRCVLCWKWPTLAMCRGLAPSNAKPNAPGSQPADPGSTT